METIKFFCYVIISLIFVIAFLVRSNTKKSKEIKRLYSNNKLRRALNGESHLDFREYSLDTLKLFEHQIDNFLLDLFEKSLQEIINLINQINQIKNEEVQKYLETSLITAINRVDTKKLAKLIVANIFDYLHFIKINKLGNSSKINEEKYFKFNLFILLRLNKAKLQELIKEIDESIDGYHFPDFTGNDQMKKWFNEEMPILLKAEFSKIKMHLQTE